MIIRSSHRLRHHRRLLLCGRLPLHRLRRRALVEGGHRQLPAQGLAGMFDRALVPVELLLKARLRIGSPLDGAHGNFEFSAAKCADSDCRSGAQPFDDSKASLEHEHLFPRSDHACSQTTWAAYANGSLAKRAFSLALALHHCSNYRIGDPGVL